MRRRSWLGVGFALVLALTACKGPGDGTGGGGPRDEGEPRRITVFAAASLRDALTAANERFRQQTGVEVLANFAGSNVLAQQIIAAGKADVFVSADESWMNRVDEAGRIEHGTRAALLSNALVVVANHAMALQILGPQDLCTAPFRYLSIGNPEAVPEGRYARRWMQSVDCAGTTLWDRVKDRVAPAMDAPSALGQVESNEQAVGVLYRTDAVKSQRIKPLFDVTGSGAPHIVYIGAAVKGRPNPKIALEYLTFLQGETAGAVFMRAGFLRPEPESAAAPTSPTPTVP